jgi:SAM-dependent methyltransferase
MKVRESGMPEEGMWAEFFNPREILHKLDLPNSGDIVDFGCGYGTFTVPAAHITSGTVYALDIEPEMAAITKAKSSGLNNVRVLLRDFDTDGSGLQEASVDYVMLFNILHADCPEVLIKEAYRILIPGGKLGIIHWNYDPNTPRGPSMDIRPRPEQCQACAEQIGFRLISGLIDLPPYHWGMVMERRKQSSASDT